ncbi:MAG: hypothetical protein AB3N14_14925 [Flavobacteriaceae bacterium]
MRKTHIILYVLLIVFFKGTGQHIIQNERELDGLKAIPKETIYLHFNDNLLLAGEPLYYAIYCLTSEKYTYSNISKIAYVELVNEERQAIFRHKIKLNSGTGYGDFLIPNDIASGNYKLLGYTRWMLNTTNDTFFQADLKIINPYLELPDATKVVEADTLGIGGLTTETLSAPTDQNRMPFRIILTQKKYGKRSALDLRIENSATTEGSYSLSIRKKYPAAVKPKNNPLNFLTDKASPDQWNLAEKDTVYLPELRGELITGQLSGDSGSPSEGSRHISLSIPGTENSVLKVVKTDEHGKFNFILDDSYRYSDAYLQVLGKQDTLLQWTNTTNPTGIYKNLDFETLSIQEDILTEIQQRSIYNQIEQAFYEQKADILITELTPLSVHEELDEVYLLDDYTRFPTLKETIVEIVDDVMIRRIGGDQVFQIRAEGEFFIDSKDRPLVLVDGLLVEDLQALLDFGARNIEKISLSKQNYYIGPQLFQGIISFKTFNNQYLSLIGNDHNELWRLGRPLPKKRYFNQLYSEDVEETQKHLPDFRNQLLWEPKLSLDQKSTAIPCYSSDNSGTYEIILQGFTKKGKPVFLEEVFEVE